MPDAKFPPPLPPRPIVREPFPLAVDRNAVTPPSGGVPIYDPDPRDGMIREMQQELVLLRDKLSDGSPSDTPIPLTRPSVRARKAAVAKVLGKAAGLLVLAPFVGAAVARKWPQYADVVDFVLQALGLK
jgi:hypothetical protein